MHLKRDVILLRRPFFLLGTTYLVSLIFAEYFSFTVIFYSIFFFSFLFLASILIKKLRSDKIIPVISITAVVAFSVNLFSYKNTVEPTEKLNGKKALITATLCELPYKSFNKYYYTLKTDSIELKNKEEKVPQNLKIKMSVSKGLDIDVYDQIKCEVSFYTKEEGAFSSKSFYRAKGINVFAYMHEYDPYEEIKGTKKPIYYYLLKFKSSMVSALRNTLLKENASLAQGLLLGDKHSIYEDTKNNFKNIGVSHLISVSGLHTSIIMSLLVALFFSLKFPKKLVYIFSVVGILIFAGITGFTTSVVRSSIMSIIYLLGRAFFKKSDSINSLGFATFLICLTNPFSGGDIGLLLSFSSTLGIIFLEPKLEKILKDKVENIKSENLKKIINYLVPSFLVTVSATVFTLPITILYFKEVSLIGVIANILIVAPSTLIFTFTLLTALFYVITPLRFLSMLCGIFANYFLSYLNFTAKILSKIPFANVSTNRRYLIFWLASIILLLVIVLIFTKNDYKKYFKMHSLLSFILLFSGILSYKFFNKNLVSLAVLDVNDGLSLVITKDNHSCIVSCGGDVTKSEEIIKFLDSRNTENLDYLVLDSFQDSNSLYGRTILEKYKPYVTVFPNIEIDDKISKFIERGSSTYFYKDAALIKIWNNVMIEPHYSKYLSYTVLKINDVKFLICSYCKDLEKIPQEDRNCAVIIEGENIKNLSSTNAKYAVMSNSLDSCLSSYRSIAKKGKIPIATAGKGHLLFDFVGGNKVFIRREV